jgi:CheY-like chemotaxis protein
VGNGQDAYDRVLRDAPDLLITDLFMPDLDGDELTRRLRQQGHDLAIIGLTAAAVGDDIDRLKLAGASAVMIKPLDIAAVRDLIGQIAARKGAPPPAAKQRRGA